MELTNENAFVGAKITHLKESENLYIYKVNSKTFYAGPKTPEEVEEFNNASDFSNIKVYKTFSALMKAVGGKQYNFSGFDISEEEAKKKEKKEKIDKLKKEQKTFLTKPAEKLLQKLFAIKKRGKGSWGHSNFVNHKHTVLLTANDEGKCVVRFGSDVIFYHVDTGLQRIFDYEKDKNGKEIIWENFEIF